MIYNTETSPVNAVYLFVVYVYWNDTICYHIGKHDNRYILNSNTSDDTYTRIIIVTINQQTNNITVT